MKFKFPSESVITMTHLVLPNDTNYHGNLIGGQLMYWMDIAAGMTASKHSNTLCVTASVDHLRFKTPIKLGNLVHLESKIVRAFSSSMEIYIKVTGEDVIEKRKYESHEAFFTFVSVDAETHPIKVPDVMPETELEKSMFEDAIKRRELRLVMAGKIKPDEALSLKNIFSLKNLY